MQRLINLFFTTLIFCLIGKIAFNQSHVDFPYYKGEKIFRSDLIDYLQQKIPINDSTGIFFIEVSYSSIKNSPDFKIFGRSSPNDSLNSVLNTFFKTSQNRWNSEILKKYKVIIPLFTITYCKLGQNSPIDWSKFLEESMPPSQLALFVKPIVIGFMCSEKCPGT